MSQENVEVVRHMNAAFNRGDLDAAFDFYEPTAIWHSRTDEPDTGDYRGREAIRQMAGMWRSLFDDFRLELDDYVDARDCVVTSGWVCGRGAESGADVRDPYAWVVRLRGGKLAEIWEYRDRAEALEAVGLSEQAMSQESAEVVRRQFEAFEHGGLDAVAMFWHPDIEWRAVEGAADDVGPIRGRDALRGYYQDWTDTLDQLHARVEEIIAEAGERIAVVVRNSGRGRTSGVRTEGRYYVACTVRDGQIVSGREYETRDQALEAVESGSTD